MKARGDHNGKNIMTDEQRNKIVKRLRKCAEYQNHRAERAEARAKLATPGSHREAVIFRTQCEAIAVAEAYRDAARMVEEAEC